MLTLEQEQYIEPVPENANSWNNFVSSSILLMPYLKCSCQKTPMKRSGFQHIRDMEMRLDKQQQTKSKIAHTKRVEQLKPKATQPTWKYFLSSLHWSDLELEDTTRHAVEDSLVEISGVFWNAQIRHWN